MRTAEQAHGDYVLRRDSDAGYWRRSQKKSRERKRAWLSEQKNRPCSRCGGSFPACAMDFHHRDPASKLFDVGACLHFSMARVIAEIAKCDLCCANCHRIIEHEEPT